MGKSERQASKEAATAQSDLAKQQTAYGKQIWGESAPLRESGSAYLQDVMKGGPSAERAFGPSLSAAANQFSAARQAIESQYPPGGARDAALRNLSVQEAGTKTGIMSSGFADAAYRSLAAGYQGAGMATGTMSQAGAMYGSSADIMGQLGSASQGNWISGAIGVGTIAALLI